jgi:hypothetical protein
MKTYGNVILMTVICIVVFWVFMALRPAPAHLLTLGEIQRSGGHWCNWSITSVCTRWRARGGKLPPGSCPPGNNWSSCRIQRMQVR